MVVENRNLKHGEFKTPDSKIPFERYIIEDSKDLKAFVKAFPEIKNFGVRTAMQDCVDKGQVVLATDKHPLSGFPTWCIESKDLSHPSSIQRI